jgi:GntR family transcriptional regulator
MGLADPTFTSSRSSIRLGLVKELFLAVDPDLAPFQQIMDQFRGLIERGEFRPGDRLPTVRQLAGDLRVAPNTVARAYAELEAEGWVTCDGRRGTHVSLRASANDQSTRAGTLKENVASFVSSLTRRGFSDAEISAALRFYVKG